MKPDEVIAEVQNRLKPDHVRGNKKQERKFLMDVRRAMESMRSALAIINVWCDFENGRHADAKDISELCDRTLKGEKRKR